MSKKSSVYFGPPLAALTSGLKPHDSVSGKLNRTAERYLAICERHGIDLTPDEKLVFSSVLLGSLVDPLFIQCLADEVADSDFRDTDAAQSLLKKIRSASYADLVAMVECYGA